MEKEKNSSKFKGRAFFHVFVLDTSSLTDPRLRELFKVDSLDAVIENISSLFAEFRFKIDMLFFVTPSIANEMRRYLLSNGVTQEHVNNLFTWLIVKSPDKLSTKIPAVVLSEYIESIRIRTFRGLRLAEDILKKAVASSCKMNKEDLLAELIREIREKYREIMRKGIVDSPEDFDVVLLAYEQKGVIVTNDEGINKMAEKLGVISIDPISFVENLKRLKIYFDQLI